MSRYGRDPLGFYNNDLYEVNVVLLTMLSNKTLASNGVEILINKKSGRYLGKAIISTAE